MKFEIETRCRSVNTELSFDFGAINRHAKFIFTLICGNYNEQFHVVTAIGYVVLILGKRIDGRINFFRVRLLCRSDSYKRWCQQRAYLTSGGSPLFRNASNSTLCRISDPSATTTKTRCHCRRHRRRRGSSSQRKCNERIVSDSLNTLARESIRWEKIRLYC